MRESTRILLEQCRDILAEYGDQITVRQLYYRLVAQLAIPNSQRAYKNLVGALTKWRKGGEVDPRAFTDLTREPELPHCHLDLADYLQEVASGYARDRWQGQRTHPEVWVEKQALATVFLPVCRRLQVTLQVCRGYASISMLVEAADRGASEIIYFGDFDPSGVDIPRSVADELRLTWGCAARLEVKALLPEQIAEHGLPPAPAKAGDSRTAGFRLAHGNETVELDALPPSVLSELIESSVMAFVDDKEEWEAASVEERDERRRLRAFIAGR